jgi:O-acetylserine/cysteine efflux transporter
MREIPPFLFTALRFALLALPLVFLPQAARRRAMAALIAVALCVGVLHFGLSFSALKLAATCRRRRS